MPDALQRRINVVRCLEAIEALNNTVTNLQNLGRFRQAADREKEIANIYLNQLSALSKACISFEKAAEWYDADDAKA